MSAMTFNDGTCLCVKGIQGACHEGDLNALFKRYGRVLNVHVPVEPTTKAARGYAFVTLSTASSAQACISALNGVEFSGCRLTVEVSKRSGPHLQTPGVYHGISSSKKMGDVGHNRRRHEVDNTSATSRARSKGRISPRCMGEVGDKDCKVSPRPSSCQHLEATENEPLSEPAAARRGELLTEPAVEPGGEPLTDEDPLCAAETSTKRITQRLPESPRTRIQRLEEANISVIAKQTVDGLLLQFQQHGFTDPRAATQECLKKSFDLLGVPSWTSSLNNSDSALMLQSPSVLVGPDEFKNPSTFLRIYGDPLAATARRRGYQPLLPERNQDGNWRCEQCNNVNFPRRQRCNKCHAIRGPNGDAIVLQYCNRVYDTLLRGKSCD